MSQTHDNIGREYLRLSEVNEKTVIEIDSGFTCLNAQFKHPVFFAANKRPFVYCKDGQHFFEGQADDGEHCVGMYPVP